MSGGWRLRIAHVTELRYSAPVRASFNEARMTPLALPGQAVLDARVEVRTDRGPCDVIVRNYSDYWGTRVSAFELPAAHDGLVIEATATVHTSAPALPPDSGRLGWDEIRRVAAGGRLLEYLLPTPLTTLPPDVRASRPGPAPDAAADAIAARVRERVAFMPGTTGVRTSAREAWAQGQGVCQDIAHVTVSLLRAAGLPARYVSGYLHPRAEPAPGVAAAGQGHAWVEYWAGAWTPLDPTHGVPVGERHVVVARGRDYADVPPLKGVYRGAPDGTMNVTVAVTRLF